jgi:hypothetical protein
LKAQSNIDHCNGNHKKEGLRNPAKVRQKRPNYLDNASHYATSPTGNPEGGMDMTKVVEKPMDTELAARHSQILPPVREEKQVFRSAFKNLLTTGIVRFSNP